MSHNIARDTLQAAEFPAHKHRDQRRKDLTRRKEYLEWSRAVVSGCCGVNPALERNLDECLAASADALGVSPATGQP